MKQTFHIVIALQVILLTFSSATLAQDEPAPKGTVQRVKVHGQLLEGNLSGDSPDRNVSVYLPASYDKNSDKRYPVVYFLHGYTDDDAKFYGFREHWMTLPPILDKVFAQDASREMIVVTPDAYTLFHGSMYSNSVTTGNWEDFIAKELVGYIDSHYRTIAGPGSRGLSGHSMGGYGAWRIAVKYPDTFSAVYLLSPCCLSSPPSMDAIPQSYLEADAIETVDGFQHAGFGTRIVFASAAAWSPNPANPPFYVDLPVEDGALQPHVLKKWDANRLLNTLDQNIFNIRMLDAIAFDAGDRDRGIAASIQMLDSELNKYKIARSFEIYEGDHINRVAERIETKVLAFFGEHLRFR